ncbi:voltage-gated potassium channel [Mycobacterium sp. OAS707]|uniref:ion transporter n=1 Tax=Mycobacterium sp. OAS707 TaxID=2663822 RepID=UPI00178AFB87|nr:ion transporter [Mycobacterium sp. OAS707]MBE1552183.1 voltage-gated potassium channel [Mycobacterium sp. OAS707]
MRTVLNGPAEERQRWAHDIVDRLTPIMSLLGIVFVLIVFGEQLARPNTALSTVLSILGWLLSGVFAAEFIARLVVAPDTSRFLRHNWWQIIFLVLPFLRLVRLVRTVKLLRSGRVLSGAVRGTRSAQAVLGSRLAGLASVVAIIILGASQLLYQFSDYRHYSDALHAAALAAITGEPLAKSDGFAQVTEVFLAAFSVVVFGALAGLLGAFFTETRRSDKTTANNRPTPWDGSATHHVRLRSAPRSQTMPRPGGTHSTFISVGDADKRGQ